MLAALGLRAILMRSLIFALPLAAATAAMQHHHGHSTNFPFPYNAKSPVPFELKLDQSFIDTTSRKVRDYRPTVGLSEEWNNEGPPLRNISKVADYWANTYDWRQVEERINGDFDHYATTVPGNGNYPKPIPLHFVHQRSSDNNAIPLLLIHGWPSTFLEWSSVIKPLAESYHIVAPDLPGFGFSPSPKQSGMGPREFGRALDALMHQLGYDKYGIVTTDLGWFTGMWMAQDVRDSIIGHMTDFFMAEPNADDLSRLQAGTASEDEVNYAASTKAWFDSHWAYATTHGQKPLALGAALADSPVGFLGWYWDVNQATSDGYEYSPEQLVTDAMMLYIPGPYANMRAYHEVFKPELMQFPTTDCPTGVSEWGWANGPFPEIANFAFVPEAWVARIVNLKFFRRHATGGHFPAVSQPDLWIKDVRDFFSGLKRDFSLHGDEL